MWTLRLRCDSRIFCWSEPVEEWCEVLECVSSCGRPRLSVFEVLVCLPLLWEQVLLSWPLLLIETHIWLLMSVSFWGKFVFIFVIKVCYLLIYINLKNKVCLLKIQPSGCLLVITDSSINPHFIVKETALFEIRQILASFSVKQLGWELEPSYACLQTVVFIHNAQFNLAQQRVCY